MHGFSTGRFFFQNEREEKVQVFSSKKLSMGEVLSYDILNFSESLIGYILITSKLLEQSLYSVADIRYFSRL